VTGSLLASPGAAAGSIDVAGLDAVEEIDAAGAKRKREEGTVVVARWRSFESSDD